MNRNRLAGLIVALVSAMSIGSATPVAPLASSGVPLASSGSVAPPPQDPAVLNSLDSLQRVITRRILSDADKKEIRACDREKSQFLKQCRAEDTSNAEVDRKITGAKLRGADPNDPAVAALLERKFSFEKVCDDRYRATLRGKQCLAGENLRRESLGKALKRDRQYQALLNQAGPKGPEPL